MVSVLTTTDPRLLILELPVPRTCATPRRGPHKAASSAPEARKDSVSRCRLGVALIIPRGACRGCLHQSA